MDAMNAMFKGMIRETRNRFEAACGKCGFFERRYRRITPPSWMRAQDHRFLELYRKQEQLFNHGHVVWGALIQANSLLFKPGKWDHPCAIIYSEDPRIDEMPGVMMEASQGLYSVKGAQTDPELQQFADKLADEIVADWKIPIPVQLTSGIPCSYITTMIIRKHLPGKVLSGSLFPFLICPEATDAGMILPGKYWDEQFVRMWGMED